MSQAHLLESLNKMFQAEYTYAELHGKDALKTLIDDANVFSRELYGSFGHLTDDELRLTSFEISKPFVHIQVGDIRFSVDFRTNASRKLMVLNVLFPSTTKSRLQEVLHW